MIYGNLGAPDGYAFLTERPVWNAAFEWLRNASSETAVGEYPIEGFPSTVARVMTYATKPIADCRFETHRKFVDLQYTFIGAEKIAWLPSSALEQDGLYDEGSDLQFYHSAPSESVVHKRPGCFSVFFPTDAHRPQIADGKATSIYKVVIKIPVNLA